MVAIKKQKPITTTINKKLKEKAESKEYKRNQWKQEKLTCPEDAN